VTTRVVLAEDNFLVREGVSRMLQTSPRLSLVATCPDLPQALAAIDEHQPDVVLTDIRMPPSQSDEGIKVAEYCRARQPRTGVVLLSQYIEPAYVRLLLTHGTEGRGYLLKERVADLDELIAALTGVAAGGSAIDPKVVEALVRSRGHSGGRDLRRLTPRERDVLAAIARGRTNAAIAATLVLSQKAVEKHINSIFSKLGLTGDQSSHPRVRAVLMYLAEEATSAS
jgi:DNA-binding NarL/FixJ family response regulator